MKAETEKELLIIRVNSLENEVRKLKEKDYLEVFEFLIGGQTDRRFYFITQKTPLESPV